MMWENWSLSHSHYSSTSQSDLINFMQSKDENCYDGGNYTHVEEEDGRYGEEYMNLINLCLILGGYYIVCGLLFLHCVWETYHAIKEPQFADKGLPQETSYTSITQEHLDNVDVRCCICLQEWQIGDRVVQFSCCNKLVYPHCISEWFHTHPTCPCCRAILTPRPPASQPHH